MLSDTRALNARPKQKPYKLADTGGLYLFVRPTGSKMWRYDFRQNDKRQTLTIGTYPNITLKQARQACDDAKKRIKSHQAPLIATTFKAIADEWLCMLEKQGDDPQTMGKKRWLLTFLSPLDNREIDSITASELLAHIRKLEATGRYESARRLRSISSRVFRYAIATSRAERDPAQDLRGALTVPKVTHRAALTEPKDIAALLRAIEAYGGALTTQLGLKLSAHTFVRPGELRKAEWGEFSEDTWRIPAAKMKMKHPHTVPLSRQARDIIRQLRSLTADSSFLFPAFTTKLRPMSENTLNQALRRMGYDKTEMTAHGFRTMASTRLNEMGYNPDAIERQLAHQPQNQIRAAYNQAQFLDERRKMMQDWSNYLDTLQHGF